MADTFETIVADSFKRFESVQGTWEEKYTGSLETIANIFMYILKTYFDKYSPMSEKVIPDFVSNVRRKDGIALLGANVEDIYPQLRVTLPSGTFKQNQLGEGETVYRNENYMTHARFNGTLNLMVQGRNALEAVRISDRVLNALTGPILQPLKVLSAVVMSYTVGTAREKKISNDHVAWQIDITLNFEIATFGEIFNAGAPTMNDIGYNITDP